MDICRFASGLSVPVNGPVFPGECLVPDINGMNVPGFFPCEVFHTASRRRPAPALGMYYRYRCRDSGRRCRFRCRNEPANRNPETGRIRPGSEVPNGESGMPYLRWIRSMNRRCPAVSAGGAPLRYRRVRLVALSSRVAPDRSPKRKTLSGSDGNAADAKGGDGRIDGLPAVPFSSCRVSCVSATDGSR